MARRTRKPAAPAMTAGETLAWLKANPLPTSVDLDAEDECPLTALLAGRSDVDRVIEIRDADARNVADRSRS